MLIFQIAHGVQYDERNGVCRVRSVHVSFPSEIFPNVPADGVIDNINHIYTYMYVGDVVACQTIVYCVVFQSDLLKRNSFKR